MCEVSQHTNCSRTVAVSKIIVWVLGSYHIDNMRAWQSAYNSHLLSAVLHYCGSGHNIANTGVFITVNVMVFHSILHANCLRTATISNLN